MLPQTLYDSNEWNRMEIDKFKCNEWGSRGNPLFWLSHFGSAGKKEVGCFLNNSVLNKSELMSEFLPAASKMRQSDYWQEIERTTAPNQALVLTQCSVVRVPPLCSNFWRASWWLARKRWKWDTWTRQLLPFDWASQLCTTTSFAWPNCFLSVRKWAGSEWRINNSVTLYWHVIASLPPYFSFFIIFFWLNFFVAIE